MTKCTEMDQHLVYRTVQIIITSQGVIPVD